MGIDCNKWLKGLTLVSAMCTGGTVLADDIVVTDGLWKVTYMESEKAFRINVLDEGGAARKCVVNHSASAAHYDNAEGTPREVTTASFATVEQSVAEVDDAFGTGRCYTFTFTGPDLSRSSPHCAMSRWWAPQSPL